MVGQSVRHFVCLLVYYLFTTCTIFQILFQNFADAGKAFYRVARKYASKVLLSGLYMFR